MRSSALLVVLLLCMILAQNVTAAPTLTSPRVTPTTGETSTTFTFTVHYRGEAPALMEVVIDSIPHQMLEVDTSDDNATDGKDYYFETTLPEGTTIYFFKVTVDPETIVRTTATTVTVSSPDWFKLAHLDVTIAVLIFLLPVTIALIIFRRFSRDMKEILEELKGKNKE